MRTATERERISLDELRRLAAGRFGDMVKAVVDVERRVMIVAGTALDFTRRPRLRAWSVRGRVSPPGPTNGTRSVR
jgi:hypothetical protein